MMLDKNKKVMVSSLDSDSDFFNIGTGVLQADALTPYNFINGLRTSIDLIIENCEKTTVKDSDYADYLALLTNTPTKAESLRYSLEQAEGLYENANKTKFISFLSCKPLKLVDLFTYLSCNMSSTKSDVNISLVKAWNSTKTGFLLSCSYAHTTVWMHHLNSNEMLIEKLDGNYTMLPVVLNKSWK